MKRVQSLIICFATTLLMRNFTCDPIEDEMQNDTHGIPLLAASLNARFSANQTLSDPSSTTTSTTVDPTQPIPTSTHSASPPPRKPQLQTNALYTIPKQCGDSFTLPVLVEPSTSDVFADVNRLSRIISLAFDDANFAVNASSLISPTYISLDLNNNTEVTRVAQKILQLIQCPTPVLSLLIPRNPGFQKLLSILDFFKIPLITPLALTDYEMHLQLSRVVSFSPPRTAQASALLDLCSYLSFSRVGLIYSLHEQSVAMSLAFQAAGRSRGITVALLKPLSPILTDLIMTTTNSEDDELEAATTAESTTIIEYAISELTQELLRFYTSRDFTVFIVAVEAAMLGIVTTSIKQTGLQGVPGISFLATDDLAHVFRSSTALLYGISEDDDELGEGSWWLGKRILGSDVDTSALQGWIFVSLGYRGDWEQTNHLLAHRLKTTPPPEIQPTEDSTEDPTEDPTRPNTTNDRTRVTATTATPAIAGYYEVVLYDLVRTLWDVMVKEYRVFNNFFCAVDVDGESSPTSLCQELVIDQIDLITHFRSASRRQPNIFKGIGDPVVVDQYGTVPPRFTLFNVRNVPGTGGKDEYRPVPITRWRSAYTSYPDYLGPFPVNPVQSSLSIDHLGRLDSILARRGAKATLPGYSAAWIPDVSSSYGQPPYPSNQTASTTANTLLNIVEFPGNPRRIPRNCLFCREGSSSPPSVSCLICEQDREEIILLYKDLQRTNPTVSMGLGDPSSSESGSELVSVCDFWPGVLDCISPWSYRIDLSGLDLEGPLPSNLGRLRHAEELRFYRNLFNGTIPSLSPHLCPQPQADNLWKRSELKFRRAIEGWPVRSQNMSKLKVLFLGKNQLEGVLPSDFGYCSHLQVLNIKNNRLKGPLPNTLCHLSELIEFDFSDNLVDDSLPNCIGGVAEGDGEESSHGVWDVNTDDYDKQPNGLTSLQYLNGDSNRLNGTLPLNFHRLSRLVLLSLKSNFLNGQLPDVFASLSPNLLVDVSQNPQLKPPLPPSLAKRLIDDATKVVVDSHLFGCSSGYRAPRSYDWEIVRESARHHQLSRSSVVDIKFFCQPCPKGTVPTLDSRDCKKCPAGSMAPRVAASTCEPCPLGSYSKKGDDLCQSCPPGTYSVKGFICHPCPVDYYSHAGSTTCAPCPSGARCKTPEEQQWPRALPGWYRLDTNPNDSPNRITSELWERDWWWSPANTSLLPHSEADDLIGSDFHSSHSGDNEVNLTLPVQVQVLNSSAPDQESRRLMDVFDNLSKGLFSTFFDVQQNYNSGSSGRRNLLPDLLGNENLSLGGGFIEHESVSQMGHNESGSFALIPSLDSLVIIQNHDNNISSTFEFKMFECPLTSRCLGSNRCSPNSYGVFCHRCLPYYTTTLRSTECVACAALGLVLLRLFIVAVILLLVGFLIFRSLRRAGKEPKQKRGKKKESFLRSDSLLTNGAKTPVDDLMLVVDSSGKKDRGDRRKTQGVILKVFTNWIELTAQSLVMAVQAATANDGQQGTNFSDTLEGIYSFIQNLDDPFFLFLPLDCLDPLNAPTPVHTGLIVGLFCPIVLAVIIYIYQFSVELYRVTRKTNMKTKQTNRNKTTDKMTESTTCDERRNSNNNHQDHKTTEGSVNNWDTGTEGSCPKDEYCPKPDGNHGSIMDHGFSYHSSSPARQSSSPACHSENTSASTRFCCLYPNRLTLRQFHEVVRSSWPSTVGVFIPIFFLLHPAITRQFLNNLECNQFDESRLARDVLLTCSHGPHVKFAYLAWTGLLLWTFGLPLVFGLMIRSHRHELHDAQVLLQWGFLLDGYEHRYYLWEIWAMARKVLVDVPPVVPFLDGDLQLVALLAVAVVSLAAHVAAEPFDNRCFKIADRLESLLLWTFLLTLLTIPIQNSLTASDSMVAYIVSKLLLAATIMAAIVFVIWALLFYFRPLIAKLDKTYWDKPIGSGRHNETRTMKAAASFGRSSVLRQGEDNNAVPGLAVPGRQLHGTPAASSSTEAYCSTIDGTTTALNSRLSSKHSIQITNRKGSVRDGCVDITDTISEQVLIACQARNSEDCCRSSRAAEEAPGISVIDLDSTSLNPLPSKSWLSTKDQPSPSICQTGRCGVRQVSKRTLKAIRSYLVSPVLEGLCKITKRILLSAVSRRILHLNPRRIWISVDGVLDISELQPPERRFLRELILEDMLDAVFAPNPKRLDTTVMNSILLDIFRRRAFQLEVRQTRERLRGLPGIQSVSSAGLRWTNPFLMSSKKKLQPLLSAVSTGFLQRLQSLRSTGYSSQESQFFSTNRLGSWLKTEPLGTASTKVTDDEHLDTSQESSQTSSSFEASVSRTINMKPEEREGSIPSNRESNNAHCCQEPRVRPDIIFPEISSRRIMSSSIWGERDIELDVAACCTGRSVQRWRRALFMVRCALALVRGLKEFRSDFLLLATSIGLTVEELHTEILRLSLRGIIS